MYIRSIRLDALRVGRGKTSVDAEGSRARLCRCTIVLRWTPSRYLSNAARRGTALEDDGAHPRCVLYVGLDLARPSHPRHFDEESPWRRSASASCATPI